MLYCSVLEISDFKDKLTICSMFVHGIALLVDKVCRFIIADPGNGCFPDLQSA